MLGNHFAPEYFDGVPKASGDPLKQICEETLSDLEGFKEILQQFGVEVIQPKLDPNTRFLDQANYKNGKPLHRPRSPLQTRDSQLVMGNDLYYICDDDHPAIKQTLSEYSPDYIDTTITRENTESLTQELLKHSYNVSAGSDWPSLDELKSGEYTISDSSISQEVAQFMKQIKQDVSANFRNNIAAPNITVVGKDVYIDGFLQNPAASNVCNYMQDFRTHKLEIGGHNDGCFHTLKPGVILSLHNIQTYSETFPEWDVCYLPDQSWDKVHGFLKIKSKNAGKWWVPGEENNDEFTNFVNTWLNDWVGYVEETVFDVNVLMLDEHHCCVSNPNNEIVNAFLKKHKIEPVHVPWRHRYFWDGGLHCITLDLYRDGAQQDYFPKRTNPIYDEVF